jgi:alpha-galactosidase
VYRLYNSLTRDFPDILFESCSSGGARFDPGILAFARRPGRATTRIAVERLRIQWGTSLAYPLSSMGNPRVAVPNQQVSGSRRSRRSAHVAFFRLSLDTSLILTSLTTASGPRFADKIAYYKRHRTLVREGLFFRLRSPFSGSVTAGWSHPPMEASALVACYRSSIRRIREIWPSGVRGLDARRALFGRGKVRFGRGRDCAFYGDELMYAGLPIDPAEWGSRGDFASSIYYLQKDSLNAAFSARR